MNSSSKHWDTIFSDTEDSKLGWYEKKSTQTLNLLNQIPSLEGSTAFLPGAGTSVLIEELLSKSMKLVLNDISVEALNLVKQRLGNQSEEITWVCQDIAQPFQDSLPDVDLWIDRAVLHFLTDKKDINGYFNNLKSLVKTGGYALFAEFSKSGARKCAGLKLHRYSVEEISEYLGPSFKIIEQFDHTYINPYGDPRPYIYVLYQKDS